MKSVLHRDRERLRIIPIHDHVRLVIADIRTIMGDAASDRAWSDLTDGAL